MFSCSGLNGAAGNASTVRTEALASRRLGEPEGDVLLNSAGCQTEYVGGLYAGGGAVTATATCDDRSVSARGGVGGNGSFLTGTVIGGVLFKLK